MSLTEELGPGAFEWQGVAYKPLLRASDSGGALSITDSMSPAGSGPPLHVHHDADESFVVLSGKAEFLVGDKRFILGPGESGFVPRETEHTFRVTDDGPSRHLIILTPGGFEGFFEEMSRNNFAIPDDMAQIVEVAKRFHLDFTGPPLDAG